MTHLRRPHFRADAEAAGAVSFPARLLWLVFAAALALAAGLARGEEKPREPVLLVPPHADTSTRENAPAPLIVPGRTGAGKKSAKQRAQDYLALGRELDQKGQLVSAVSAYRNAILFDSTLTGVAFRMGQILASLGDDVTAMQMFATEVTRDPGNDLAARELGLALSRLGQHETALAQLQRGVRRHPKEDDYWSALGIGQLSAGRAAAAESSFRKAISLPPPRPHEHRDLGAALAALGKTDAARASYQRAIQEDPKDAVAWLNLGNLEREAGHSDRALEAYREAERRDSTLAAAIAAQARLLDELDRAQEAGAAFHRWVARSPYDLGARLEAVNHFVREGRADHALEIARDAQRLDPRSPDTHLLTGIALDAAGRKREALEELRLAEALFRSEAGKGKARQLIATLRASAPDSLRAYFTADSIAHIEKKK